MARIPDIERRLLNWARWRALMSDGGGNFARASMEERVDGEGWDAPTVINTLDAEAEETERGVLLLQSPLRAAVEIIYIGNGTIKRKAARLCVSEATLYLRVDQAHRALASWLSEKARAQQEHKRRLQALQGAARP
jgi:hypothetical protein